MAKITIEELSESLKEYLNGLGLTEAQVQELIDNMQEEVIGNKEELATNDKSSIVAAINELFQNANNGKELIANAIGEPVSSEDTFSAMSNDINGLLSTFKTNMMNNGVTVEAGDKFKALIDKIATLADNEGKGIQFAEGSIPINDRLQFQNVNTAFNFTFAEELNFNPTYIFVKIPSVQDFNEYLSTEGIHITSMVITQADIFNSYQTTAIGGDSLYVKSVDSKGFSIGSNATTDMYFGPYSYGNDYNLNYVAIGVGEEDTTLRDSLASILQEEGVSVTEEDDMASLIGKVDEEFTKDNNTISGLENDINNGKSIIANAIGTPLTSTDTFTEMGSDINGLLSTFKTNMMNNGVTIESGDKFKALIDKIATLAGNGSKGVQFASGQIDTDFYSFANVNTTHTFNFNESLNFTPTYLFIRIPYVKYTSTNGTGDSRNAIVSNLFNDIYDGTDWAKQLRVGCISSEGILNIKSVSASGFVMEGDTGITFGYSSSTGYESDNYIDWYAIGVGEEDTTLRDSLASILEEEGVSVTEEDDMASLISKVDEEFSNLNSMLIPNYNILYDHGTLNTNMLGGFNFEKSYTAGSTFTEESDCLMLRSWSTSDTYDYAISKYTVKPYPYTKLKFTYSAVGMGGSCKYEIGYTTSSVTSGGDLTGSKQITSNTSGTVTAEFSLSNNMEPITIVLHGYAPSYAERTAILYVYKIELL